MVCSLLRKTKFSLNAMCYVPEAGWEFLPQADCAPVYFQDLRPGGGSPTYEGYDLLHPVVHCLYEHRLYHVAVVSSHERRRCSPALSRATGFMFTFAGCSKVVEELRSLEMGPADRGSGGDPYRRYPISRDCACTIAGDLIFVK